MLATKCALKVPAIISWVVSPAATSGSAPSSERSAETGTAGCLRVPDAKPWNSSNILVRRGARRALSRKLETCGMG